MRWSHQERAVFWELWGEEPPPTGWRAARERLADWWGQDRALARWSVVVVGGDGVLATLALWALARRDPGAQLLWVPDAQWSGAPYVWAAQDGVQAQVCAAVGMDTGDLGAVLAGLRRDARARLEAGGGSWRRCERRLFDTAVPGGRVCVCKPRGTNGAVLVAQTEAERRVAQWWTEAVRDAPGWPTRSASMVGGVAKEVWVLGYDRGREGWIKDAYVRDFGLSICPTVPILQAQSQWWEAAQALLRIAQTGLAVQVGKDTDDTPCETRVRAGADGGFVGWSRPGPVGSGSDG